MTAGIFRTGSALLAALLVLGGCQPPKREATAPPPPVRRAESLALAEIRQLVRGGRALNVAFEPRTPEGKTLKAVIEEAGRAQREFETARTGLSYDTILSPQRLGTAEGVAQSKAEIERLRQAAAKYYGRSLWAADRIEGIVQGLVRGAAPDRNLLRTEIETARLATNKVGEAANALLTYIARVQPRPDPTGKELLFATQKDLTEFNRLVTEIQKAGREEQRVLNRLVDRRQAALDSALQRIQG